MTYRTISLLYIAFLVVLFTGCRSAESDRLVIYSGRSQVLVDELVDRFTEQTGIEARVRYGSDAQLLATLQEEGDRSPADLFWANTTGALGEASNAGLLSTLPDSLLNRPVAFAPSSGLWTPVTTRFRVLAYHTDRVDADALPASVMELPEMDQFEGRVGWTPAYSSFQDFVTAMRMLHGEDTTRAWLEGMQALQPNAYTSNTPMIRALADGEIDVALTNHYYVLRLKHDDSGDEEAAGNGSSAAVETYHFESGDVGNLALVTGAGVLATGDQEENALRFLSFLLSEEAQSYAADEVYEYPVVPGVEVPGYMLPVDEALELSPTFDFEQLRDLDATLDLLRDVGLL